MNALCVISSLKHQRARATLLAALSLLLAWVLSMVYRRYVGPKPPKGPHRSLHRGGSGGATSSSRGHSRSGEKKKTSRRKKSHTDASLPNLVLLAGMYGSGKTHWAKRFVEKVNSGYTIISSDAIRESITGEVVNEEAVRAEIVKRVGEAISEQRSCIVDDCCHILSRDFREQLKAVAPESVANRFIKFFPIKVSLAQMRLEKLKEEGARSCLPEVVDQERWEQCVTALQLSRKAEGWHEHL